MRRFPDGRDLLEQLRREKPDLVVLDVMLPDVDGVALCRAIRGDRTLSPIPIIMLTARIGEADRVLGLELGADDYVARPFSPVELAARCPIFPGSHRRLFWPFPDPAGFTGSDQEVMQNVRQVRDEIREKVRVFVKEDLPAD